jgi:hypothetical protein
MRRMKWCVALVLLWSLPLRAQVASPDEQSALPWLHLDALSATRDKPLFAPSRRKAAPPRTVSPPPLAQVREEIQQSREEVQRSRKPQLVLTGIIASTSQSVALLRDTNTSESMAVRSGETIGRWRVLVDTDHSVKLQDDSNEVELEIFDEP